MRNGSAGLVVEPDSEGRVRPDCDTRPIDVWETASRLHFNLDFQLNSQSLAACLTSERSIGGTAWPNFRVDGDARRGRGAGALGEHHARA